MWASFYANLQPGLKNASTKAKRNFLNGCIRPIASFRWSRWPFQTTYANKLDGLQVNMAARLFDIKPRTQEDLLSFYERRGQHSRQMIDAWGRWSLQWRNHVKSWNDHVMRAHDTGAWSHKLLDWHGEAWLQERRVEASHGGMMSRTGTRAQAGRPATRWFEGLVSARAA